MYNHNSITDMADSNSCSKSSTSASDSSEFEGVTEGRISANEIEPFSCVQPRHFVPQWKTNETNKTGECTEISSPPL